MLIRRAEAKDLDVLWRFLALAASEADVASARRIPMAAAHLIGWPRPGDFGVVAEVSGAVMGAAWARQFDPSEQPFFWVDGSTPEVSVAVIEAMRGKGVGTRLLEALITQAEARGVGLCLNVRTTNPAIRLYERLGFVVSPGSERPNRTGGVSVGMERRVRRRG